MHRILCFGNFLFLTCAHLLAAANPDDIDFRARLLRDTRVYHTGESIELEISYSSPVEKKYHGSFSGPNPWLDGVTPRVLPPDGFLDLRELRRDRGGAGSILGGLGYVGSQAITQKLDLSQWFRIQRPGHYSVVIISKALSRLSTEDRRGWESLTLESNSVDFDILPADPAWAAGELRNIEHGLNPARLPYERDSALRRLAMLDTPASVQMLFQTYLASSPGGEEWIFNSGLRDSSQLDIIIPLIERALSDPTGNIPSGLPELLADLQTRKELGVMPGVPSDTAKQPEWAEAWKGRSKVHDKYLAQANALIMASIERRSGSQRAAAIYQVWYDAGQLNLTKPLAPEVLSRLQSQVLAVADELNHTQQVQFVVIAWQSMPHEQLLPMIRKLAKDSFAHAAGYDNHEAIRLWCEGWPEECSAGILSDVLASNAKTDKNVILLMSEAEHPELDQMLGTQLKELAAHQDVAQAQRTAAVILRVGSREITSSVDSFLDQLGENGPCDGETQGELLAYLFRVEPDDGGKLLSAELQDKNHSCGSQVLRTLHLVRPSEELIPFVTKALDSPNLGVAQLAALFLGQHGAASAQEYLWQRLEALWNGWRDRSPELSSAIFTGGTDIKDQTAMLEQALASALSHATNWKMSPAELERLRTACLTQPCRDISDGKMVLGM